ncbi:MAG: prenyltransferase/squalene oxidase repeat-containing protein [Pirellulales bacterium]
MGLVPNTQPKDAAVLPIIPRSGRLAVSAVLVWLLAPAIATSQESESQPAAAPVDRAIAFLAREVQAWTADKHCFSCHNNGDAVRVLYVARRLGHDVDIEALAPTTAWLADPARWEEDTGDETFKDKELAAIQFGSALLEAIELGIVPHEPALMQAARSIASFQDEDGAWRIDGSGLAGSPITYGTALATSAARRVLVAADRGMYAVEIAATERWLRSAELHSMPDLAGTLLALREATDQSAGAQRRRAFEKIAAGQNQNGGWGPFADRRPEAFDSAIVLVSLAAYAEQPEVRQMIQRGRAYLVDTQLEDGGWDETTRPAGAQSYAHRISTSAWATLALVLTEPKSKVTRQ